MTYPLTSSGTCDHCAADETSMNPDGSIYCHQCGRVSSDDEFPIPNWMEEDVYEDREEEFYDDHFTYGGDL